MDKTAEKERRPDRVADALDTPRRENLPHIKVYAGRRWRVRRPVQKDRLYLRRDWSWW